MATLRTYIYVLITVLPFIGLKTCSMHVMQDVYFQNDCKPDG